MSIKPIIPRERARRDIDDAADYYLREAGEEAALGFIAALEQAWWHIARHPASGSPRYAHELDMPGLRSWRLKRYPYLVFFTERADHVDVWRVLHVKRDVPAWMREAQDI